jgi:phospholipase C
MTRSALLCLLVLLVSATALLVGLNACGTPTMPNRLGQGKLLHIVIVVQENRTPDNLFHDPVLMGRGADIATIASTSSGSKVSLEPAPLGVI